MKLREHLEAMGFVIESTTKAGTNKTIEEVEISGNADDKEFINSHLDSKLIHYARRGPFTIFAIRVKGDNLRMYMIQNTMKYMNIQKELYRIQDEISYFELKKVLEDVGNQYEGKAKIFDAFEVAGRLGEMNK